MRSQYLLAYEPSNQALDGSYRKIEIQLANPRTCKRKGQAHAPPGIFCQDRRRKNSSRVETIHEDRRAGCISHSASFRFKVIAMSNYEFVTVWHIDAPIERVWDDDQRSDKLARMVARRFARRRTEKGRRGRSRQHSPVNVEKCLPYKLEFDSEVVADRDHEADRSPSIRRTRQAVDCGNSAARR